MSHGVLHHGVTCDVSGQSPLIGTRCHLIGQDYDVNEAAFAALPDSDKALYEVIEAPGATPAPYQSQLCV